MRTLTTADCTCAPLYMRHIRKRTQFCLLWLHEHDLLKLIFPD